MLRRDLTQNQTRLAIAAVLVLAAAGLWFALRHNGADDPAPSVATSYAAPVDAARAQQFTAALASGNEAQLRSVAAIPADQPIEANLPAELAALSPITFDPASFIDAGDGSATISASTTAPPQTWTVALLDLDGSWVISFTSST